MSGTGGFDEYQQRGFFMDFSWDSIPKIGVEDGTTYGLLSYYPLVN
jgi:hypothetical protein